MCSTFYTEKIVSLVVQGQPSTPLRSTSSSEHAAGLLGIQQLSPKTKETGE